MSECVFCDIVANSIPAERVYEDERIVAFPDLHPAAPFHVLVIPKEHIASLDALSDKHKDLASHLVLTARQLGREHDTAGHGYRIVSNTGKQADVPHLHVHVLGGKEKLGPLVG